MEESLLYLVYDDLLVLTRKHTIEVSLWARPHYTALCLFHFWHGICGWSDFDGCLSLATVGD